MSRTQYAPKEFYTGDGTLAVYTFDFKIEALTHLEVVVIDNLDVEIERVRGDDTVFLSSVVFNSSAGGGNVTLQANLPTGYKIYLILANDAPVQNFLFSNKLSFNLKYLENALDYISGVTQRLTYKSKQAIRLNDADDEETINTQLPPDFAGNSNKVIKVNATGDGLMYADSSDAVTLTDINVTGVTQGRYTSGDIIAAGTDFEEILRNMLTLDTPPVFTLAGSGTLLVESGTVITPTLTPAYIDNDAGPSNNYELRKNGVAVFTDTTPVSFIDSSFSIVDTTVAYQATVDYDADIVIAGSLISNTVTYRGARAAFFQVGGDIVNIRTNTGKLINAGSGSNLVTTGDDVSLTAVFAYPDTLGNPTSLFFSNTGGNFDITSDLVRETDQSVNDAGGANAITYRVYSYTALIPIESADTLTFKI